jgi:hypothetical protein
LVVRRPRSGRPRRSSPEGRAKSGWEAGIPRARFSSVCGFSLLVANPFAFCALAQTAVCVCLRPLAGCFGFCRLDVTQNVTRREWLTPYGFMAAADLDEVWLTIRGDFRNWLVMAA